MENEKWTSMATATENSNWSIFYDGDTYLLNEYNRLPLYFESVRCARIEVAFNEINSFCLHLPSIQDIHRYLTRGKSFKNSEEEEKKRYHVQLEQKVGTTATKIDIYLLCYTVEGIDI